MFVFSAIINNQSFWEFKDHLNEQIFEVTNFKNEQNESAFIVACKIKNLSWVDFLLSLGADPLDVNSNNQNALHLLIDKDIPLMTVSALIELGANPNHQDKDGQTALFYSVKHARPDLTHLLLGEDANSDILDKEGNSPLMLAALSGNIQNVKLLLESGAKIDVCNERGQNALHLAVLSGSDEMVKLLIEYGIPVNVKDILGRNALHYSAIQENCLITNTLAEAGVEINTIDIDGLNPLMLASIQGIPVQVEELIKVGASVSNLDQQNETCLVKALKQSPITVYHILAAEKVDADPSQKISGVTQDLSFMNEVIRISGSSEKEDLSDIFRVSSKESSTCGQYDKVAELLLNTEIPFDFEKDIKNKPNLYDQIKNNEALLKTLTNHESKKESGQLKTRIPPTSSAEKEKEKEIKAKQAKEEATGPKGITLNARDAHGVPILIVFATHGKHEVVEQMLIEGNDFKIRDKFGRTALMAASKAGHVETIKVILKYDKDINYKTPKAETALLMAIMENKIEAVRILLESGANPDTRFKGVYLLHLVAESGNAELAKIMIEHNANPGVKDIKGRSPAQYAKAKGQKELEGILGGPKVS